MTDYVKYYRYWAKTPPPGIDARCHLLPYHNLDVAACGRVILEKNDFLRRKMAALSGLPEDTITRLIVWLLSIHDIGKFSESFQNLDLKLFYSLRGRNGRWDVYPVRHDSLGYYAWNRFVFREVWDKNLLNVSKNGLHARRLNTLLDPLLRAISGHHGSPPIPNPDRYDLPFFDEEAQEDTLAFVRETAHSLLSNFRFPESISKANIQKSSWLVAGIAVLSDWIGSNHRFFSMCDKIIDLDDYWKNIALPNAELAVSSAGVSIVAASSETGISVLFNYDEPTPMQKHIEACEVAGTAQLFIIEDATGSGKTEAVITLAHRLMIAGLAWGVYFGLPTMATANRMYERVIRHYQKLYSDTDNVSVVLAHSARGLSEAFNRLRIVDPGISIPQGDAKFGEAQCVAWLADNQKKALLAHVGVGTIDQALLGILPSSHQSLRLLGLAQKVLIVDEVHAYDSYMHRILCRLLEFQAAHGGSAILLSATLPQKTRQELCNAFRSGLGLPPLPVSSTDYPLITHVSRENVLTETHIPTRKGMDRKIRVRFFHDECMVKKKLLEIARKGGCACWIRNTVDDAIESWNDLKNTSGIEVHLFHARFVLGDRLDIEEEVARLFDAKSTSSQREGRIVIATQVVEQSLDLDFDFLITDLAPIDLIIQRAGRLRRHVRDKDGNRKHGIWDYALDERGEAFLGVLTPSMKGNPSSTWYSDIFPRGQYVYTDVGRLWLTAKVLNKLQVISIPENARQLIEFCYSSKAEQEIPQSLKDRTAEAERQRRIHMSLSDANALRFDAGYGGDPEALWHSEERTPTRLGPDTITLRLGIVAPDNSIQPIYQRDDRSWAFSEVTVYTSKIKEPLIPVNLQQAAERARQGMRDKCRFARLMVLEESNEKSLTGMAVNEDGQTVRVVYSKLTGLSIHPLS